MLPSLRQQARCEPDLPRRRLALCPQPLARNSSTRMSATKLSPALKALIAAPHARGKPLPSPPAATTSALFDALRSSAKSNGVGNAAWVTLSVCEGHERAQWVVMANRPTTDCCFGHVERAGDALAAKQGANQCCSKRRGGAGHGICALSIR